MEENQIFDEQISASRVSCRFLEKSRVDAEAWINNYVCHLSRTMSEICKSYQRTPMFFVLCLTFCSQFGRLLRSGTGTGSRIRFIDVSKFAANLGVHVCSALLGLHAYRIYSCYSVSAFAGRGNVSALKLITQNGGTCEAMVLLGQQWEMTTDLFAKINAFICHM